jgi:hypothetical protein
VYLQTSALRRQVKDLLIAPSGLNYQLSVLAGYEQAQPVNSEQILEQNVSSDLAEKTISQRYPSLSIYCDRITNEKRERFSPFSGSARMAIEVRVSGEDVQRLERELGMWADAIAATLENSTGNWGAGVLYSGRYEVNFSAVRRGGLHLVQGAKVLFEVQVSSVGQPRQQLL